MVASHIWPSLDSPSPTTAKTRPVFLSSLRAKATPTE